MDRSARNDRGPGDRLLCDVMLGRLARWLRALGHDTAYDQAADDAGLLRRAARERRILVTRDTRIVPPPRVRLLLLHENDTADQLRELAGLLDLGAVPARPARCLACNARLRRATPEEVEARAPDHVRATQRDFRACRGCGRVYWPGTHSRKLANELERALAGTDVGQT